MPEAYLPAYGLPLKGLILSGAGISIQSSVIDAAIAPDAPFLPSSHPYPYPYPYP